MSDSPGLLVDTRTSATALCARAEANLRRAVKNTGPMQRCIGPGVTVLSSLRPHQLLVGHSVGLIRVGAFALPKVLDVRLVVPFVPDDFRIPLEREDVRRDSVEEPAIV